MTNPILENIRRSLGRTAQTPPSLRPAISEPRQAQAVDIEIETFLNEIKKLSGTGRKLAPSAIDSALQALMQGEQIKKATVWETPYLRQWGVAEILNGLGVDL